MATSTLDEILTELRKLNSNSRFGGNNNNNNNVNNTGYDYVEQKNIFQKFSESRKAQKKAEGYAKHARDRGLNETAKTYENRAADAKNAKYSAASVISGQVAGMLNQTVNTLYTVLNNAIKKEGIRIDSAAEMQQRAIQMWGKSMSEITATQTSMLFDDAMKSAYKALNTTQQMGKDYFIRQGQDRLTMLKQSAEINKINADNANAIQKTAFGIAGNVLGMIGPIGSIVASGLSVISNVADNEIERQKAKIDLEIKLTEQEIKLRENIINSLNDATKSYREMAEKANEVFLDLSNSAYQYGRTSFMSAQNLEKFETAYVHMNKRLAYLNMDYKDYVKMQDAYNESNGGRMSFMSETAALGTGLLSKQLGVSVDSISGITGSMNVFNTSIEDGNQMIYKMSQNVAKAGLNASKFAKDLQKNLKLAEKYQFRGGVEGMMKMSMWAQKTRFNMDELSGALDKMHTGNIEDVMQTSAKLNVLGGNAAMLSDPMSMLFNAYADPTQYAKNINQMISGFGHFNKKTGETEFSINEQMRMEAMASALGVSKENFMNQARQTKKMDRIKQGYGGKFGDKLDFVANNATWDKVKKDWVVSVRDANDKITQKSLSELNVNELDSIFPEDKQDQLIDLVSDIRSYAKYLSPKENSESAQKITLGNTLEESSEEQHKAINDMAESQKIFGEAKETAKIYAKAISLTNEAAKEAQTMVQGWTKDKDGLMVVYKSLLEGQNKAAQANYDKIMAEGGYADKIMEAGGDLARALELITDEIRKSLPEGAGGEIAEEYEALIDTIQKVADRSYITSGKGKWNNKDFAENSRMERKIVNGTEYVSITLDSGLGNYDDSKRKHVFDTLTKKYGENNVILDDRSILVNSKEGRADWQTPIQGDDVIATNEQDIHVWGKTGGFLDKLSKTKRDETPQNINLTVNGSLKLDAGNKSIDIIEMLRNDPNALRELVAQIFGQASSNKIGGKRIWMDHRNAM